MAKSEEVTHSTKRGKMSTEDGSASVPVLPKGTSSGTQEIGAATSLIPSFADACKFVSTQYSCLVVDTSRRHIALSPMYLKKKKTGIQEELNAELLKYSESMHGVPMAYDGVKVVGQLGDIYDDQGFIHMNIEATFVIFRPKRGQKLVGVINKLGVGHVGCLVHGCFNASIPKPYQVALETWKVAGFNVGDSLEFEVSHLDVDTAGVFLIRGRLDKNRVQELIAIGESGKQPSEEEPVTLASGDSTDGPKLKKKKKRKDKYREDKAMQGDLGEGDSRMDDGEGCEASGTIDAVNGKKKKKKRRRKSEGLDEGPSCGASICGSVGELEDRKARKRKRGSEEGRVLATDTETLKPKKKKNALV